MSYIVQPDVLAKSFINVGCQKCTNNTKCEECIKAHLKFEEIFSYTPKKYKITLELDDNLVLPNKQVKGMTSNRKYWWIRDRIDNFVDIGKIAGNIKFKMNLELEEGPYNIGCGTPKNSIRKNFYVSKDEEHIFVK